MTTPYAPPAHPLPQPTDEHRALHAEHHLLVALAILTIAAISFGLDVLLLLLTCSATVTS